MCKKVLVIEDNEQNRYLVRFILERNGCEVIEAKSGPEGLRLAETELPDLILLDIQLPGMDGYEVASLLREHPSVTGTPIVAVTSYAMPGDREKALEVGCDGYIEKPIQPARFFSQINRFLADGA